jgi:hypothetical protein
MIRKIIEYIKAKLIFTDQTICNYCLKLECDCDEYGLTSNKDN